MTCSSAGAHRAPSAILFVLFLCLFLGLPSMAAAGRPNVLLIVADDLGLQLPAFGDHTVATPGIDAIAHQGVVFRNAYTTQSSCSPARASLYTGTYPHQNGQIGLAGSYRMTRAYPTIPSILHQAGYRTGIIGKTHIAPLSALKWDFARMSVDWDEWRRTMDVCAVAAEARTFFGMAGPQPFFLQVSLIDPHDDVDQFLGLPPVLVKPEDITINAYTGAVVPAAQKPAYATYYNSIKRLDEGVRLLLAELSKAGAADNTLVIFVSDNAAGPVQGGKTDIYENGLRIPLIIRYPGVASPGLQRSQLVSMVDLLPTILAATGTPMPQVTRTMMRDGRSLLPLLGAATAPAWRTSLFAEMNFHYPEDNKPSRSVRNGRYKLIHSYPPLVRGVGGFEVFDLQKDPFEKKNIFLSVDPAVRERLQETLSQWQTRTGDSLPH